MIRRCLSILLLSLAALAGLPQPLFAAQPVKAVEATGLAAVIVDPVSARDRALVDAKRKAVEEIAGVEVDARATYSMGLSEEDWLRVRSFGYVQRYEVLDEREAADRYQVTIRAWVQGGAGNSAAAAAEFLSQRSFLIFGHGEGAERVVDRLKEVLLERGFSAYDEQFVRSSYRDAGLAYPTEPGSPAKAPVDVAARFLSDYIIRVETDVSHIGENFGIQAYQARAKIQLTEVTSSYLKAFAEVSSRVFGMSRDQALTGGRKDQFPRAIAEPAVEEFLQKLDQFQIGTAQRVRIALKDPGSPAAIDRLLNSVREVRWVQAAEKEAAGAGTDTLLVEYPEKPVYLAADIDFLPNFAVTSYGPGYVAVVEE